MGRGKCKTEFEFGHHKFNLGDTIPRVTYLDAINQHVEGAAELGLNWFDSAEITKQKISRIHRPEKPGQTHEMITELFEGRVESKLIAPIFITEFAKAVSPLAKSKPDNPAVADRFELYICGMEIANGYSELNDPREQYERFKEQVAAKASGDEEAQDMDEDYIRALEYGMPPASGLGVGIDRLAMVLTNSLSIRDVILFPLLKPE